MTDDDSNLTSIERAQKRMQTLRAAIPCDAIIKDGDGRLIRGTITGIVNHPPGFYEFETKTGQRLIIHRQQIEAP